MSDPSPPPRLITRVEIQNSQRQPMVYAQSKVIFGRRLIEHVYAERSLRSMGLASAVVGALVDLYADEDLFLQIDPFDDEPLSAEDLERWYARFGFRRIPETPGWMIRPANTTVRPTGATVPGLPATFDMEE